MASGFCLAFFLCLTGGLLISGAMSAPAANETAGPCCPPVWTQFGSRCFIFHLSAKTWTDAEQMCISDGGNLASIHSEDENNFLKNMIVTVAVTNTRVWIGGYDAVTEGTWQWSDGSKLDYQTWYQDQPDNTGGNEHCLEMYLEGLWNDLTCDGPKSYVCAKDTSH